MSSESTSLLNRPTPYRLRENGTSFAIAAAVWAILTITTAVCLFVFISRLNLEPDRTTDFIKRYSYLEASAFIILSFSTIAWRLLPGSARSTKAVHAIFNFIALILLLSAAGTALSFKRESEAYESVHSWMAMVTYLLALVQGLIGIISFVWPTLRNVHAVVPWHRFFGQMTYCALFTTVQLGLLNLQHVAHVGLSPNWLSLLVFFTFSSVLYWWSPASPVSKKRGQEAGGSYQPIAETEDE